MFDFSSIPPNMTYFLDGIIMTLIIAFFSVILGTVIGTLAAVAKRSKILPLRWLMNIYTEIFRNTPMLVQITLGFQFLSGQFFPSFQVGIFTENLNRIIPGILIIALNSGAYMCETVRAGINAVPKGQTEAAYSLGIRPSQTMYKVILPQAFRNILPALGNEFVTIVKDSSLLSTIGVYELYLASNTVGTNIYQPIPAMLTAAAFYFVVCFVLNRGVAVLEKRFGKGFAN
ncbi:MAG: amino acid ABC transporter permease [Streptococcaceae bacterium]|jgi:polar amino acid transport system permease protein|nr:amino acid ABC transporter permease [Streptococcaceae bacterium]